MKDIVVLNYNLGNACNLRCKFCYNDGERNEKQYYKDFDEITNDLKKLSKKSKKMFFIGGEPLYHPNIFEIIDLTNELGFEKISIVTNGIRFSDEKFSEEFLRKNITQMIFSIHAHNNSLDDEISDRKNTFVKRELSLSYFKKYNINNIGIGLNLVLNTLNIKFIPDIVDYYYNYGFKTINLYGMLQDKGMSDTNISIIPNYLDVINNLNDIRLKDDIRLGAHWMPLCVSSRLEKMLFIREVRRDYIYNIGNSSKKLFDDQIKHKTKLKECKSCYAYGKFCFGVYNQYLNIHGDNNFMSLSKETVYRIIKKYGVNKKIIPKKQ